MKKIFFTTFLAFLFMLIFANKALVSADNYPFSAGLSVSGKMGINAAKVPDGIQNNPSLLKGVDFGVLGYLPMSEDSRTGLFVELGYTNTPFALKNYATNITGHINQKLLTISPYLLMSGFTIGLDFGFALSKTVDPEVLIFTPMDNDINVNIRVGGMIPLHTSSIGTLNFIANATYSLTGLQYLQTAYTYQPSTLSIGLNYLFNLEGF